MTATQSRTRPPVAKVGGVVKKLIKFDPWRYSLVLIVLGAWWSFPILVGLGMQTVVDAIAGDAQTEFSIPALFGILVAVETLRQVFFVSGLMLLIPWWVRAETLMRTNMLAAQLASGGREAGPPVRHAGAAVAVFRNDVEDVMELLDNWLDLAGITAFTVMALTIMATIDLRVTLVVVIPLLLAIFVTRALTMRLQEYRRVDREATSAVTGFLGNLFSAVLAVKVAGAEPFAGRRLRQLNATRLRTALRDKVLAQLLEAFNSSTVEVSVGLVLLFTAPAMRSGDFTVGDLALFATYVGWLAMFPRMVGSLLMRHKHGQVAAGRMRKLVPGGDPNIVATHRALRMRIRGDQPMPVQPRPSAPAAAGVAVHDLEHRFADGAVGLEAVNLTLEPGSFTVVCGPVGSGKTTLLRTLMGLADRAPDGEADDNSEQLTVDGRTTGTVTWNGELVADPAAHFIPPNCGYVPQVPRLFSATLRENLTLGVDTTDRALHDAIHRAALDVDLATMPDGLDTMVGPRGVRLSGGQVQRTATARALAADPALLVLDDLSSALDANTERQLWTRLLDDQTQGGALSRTPTVLVVSHRAAALERADQIIMLDEGRILARGTFDELRAQGMDPLGMGVPS